MKTNKWILGGLMAMAITACTSDELVENNSQQPAKGEVVTVTAYAPGNNTNSRVEFNESTTQGVSFDLSWSNNDKFTVIKGKEYTNFTNGDGDDNDNTFTGILPYDRNNTQSKYYAVYPALRANTSLTAANIVPFNLSTQTGALDESMTYMRSSSTDGLSYSFKHCTAILKATFANIPPGAEISQVVVTLHTDNKVDGTLDLTTGTISGGSNSKNTITINYTPPVDANANIPVYIYLPPMAAEKKALTFEVITNVGNYTGTLGASTSNANQGPDIEAGNLYEASVQMSRLIAEGLSFDPGTSTFHITKAFGLQLLDKWISNKISTANFKKYDFRGNTSVNDNNRYSLNISIEADIELPEIDIETGKPITVTNGVPSGSNWIPLQDFSGSIDGYSSNDADGKYSIKNLRINGGDKSNQGFVGSFSNSGSGSITNLKFEDAVVFATSEGNSEGNNVGVVVGNNRGKVQSCHVTGNSKVSGRIVGGVVGANNNGTVDNCVNYAEVNGVLYSGGIVGSFSHNNGTTISKCMNYGNVSISELRVGGIVGFLNKSIINISECENHGTITGAEEVGGILGCGDGSNEVSQRYIERCYNYGAVTGGESGGEQFVGGIVGLMIYATIRGCNNYASVTGHGYYIGGIVGSIKNSILTNCNNIASGSMAVSGVVKHSQKVGGIAGYIYKSTVENCENNCPVSGATPIGGIVGYTNSNSTVRGCINYGTTTATCEYRDDKGVGGVVGFIEGNSNVENCKNNSQVSGFEQVGGIVGHSTGFSIVLGSINNGVVASKKYTDDIDDYYAGGIVGYNETAGVIACGNNATITSPKYVGGVVGGMIGTRDNNNWTANVGIYGSWSIINEYVNNYFGYNAKQPYSYYHDYGNYVGDATTLNTKVGLRDDGTSGGGISMNKALENYYTEVGSSLATKYYWMKGGNDNSPVFSIPASTDLNNFGLGGNLTPSAN